MKHRFLLRAALTAVTLTAAAGLSVAPAHADPLPPAGDVTAAYPVAPCDPKGVTSSDNALATTLNGKLTKKMRGYMTGYQVSCARRIVETIHGLGMHPRAAVIAITTVIIESSIQNITQEVDHDSLGLYQQRASWGSRAQRLDPVWATKAFISKMKREYPNNAWMNAPIGEVCQSVQVSAYPDRYQPQAGDAQIIVDHLRQPTTNGRDSVGYYNPSDGSFHLSNELGESTGSSDHAWDTALEAVPNAVVLTGDWNGEGKDSTGYYNPADGTFHLSNALGQGSSNYAWDTGLEAIPDAVVLTGDWNGDGKDSTGYYNPSDGTFHLSDTLGQGGSSQHAWDTALETIPNAVVLTGDWNGDGKDSTGYYNPSDGTFHLSDTLGQGGSSQHAWDTALETIPNAVILTGDWNGDGKDSTGYYNPSDGSFHLSNSLGGGSSSDYAWDTGLEAVPDAVVLTGDWNGA
ncbi:hypothetical protein [Nonomuraea sp. SYSU D8015]|uniref:hypothetical protein n=1 Tax=Nonomuraea sp. SYSU D8015 TaxID=2593644 RepID=UPI00166048FC|nr:hypothetical protein [Nonomuraea sp. SYSU D8015]